MVRLTANQQSSQKTTPLRIGIVGAGFSGTALAALLHRDTTQPLQLFLFDKRGDFAVGEAYSTPYPFHLLNVRAKDMSAFEDAPNHFVAWLQKQQHDAAVANQFVSRALYGKYLKDLLVTIASDTRKSVSLTHEAAEVVDVTKVDNKICLLLADAREVIVDKVVFALGNGAPSDFPFPVNPQLSCIHNSWDYQALSQIPQHDPVVIVGTGLSMVDAILTLHHQKHAGNIYAVSRHGLLPLPHGDLQPKEETKLSNVKTMRSLANELRALSQKHILKKGDWRVVVDGLRAQIPALWKAAAPIERKRFLRHVAAYWNVHRHRIYQPIAALLAELQNKQQLEILGARIVTADVGNVVIRLRHSQKIRSLDSRWLINCMGPQTNIVKSPQKLVQALLKRSFAKPDDMSLGFVASQHGELQSEDGTFSSSFYALGPCVKGMAWEGIAVPEIRNQCFLLARQLLKESYIDN